MPTTEFPADPLRTEGQTKPELYSRPFVPFGSAVSHDVTSNLRCMTEFAVQGGPAEATLCAPRYSRRGRYSREKVDAIPEVLDRGPLDSRIYLLLPHLLWFRFVLVTGSGSY